MDKDGDVKGESFAHFPSYITYKLEDIKRGRGECVAGKT